MPSEYVEGWEHTARFIEKDDEFLMVKLETVFENASRHLLRYVGDKPFHQGVVDCIRQYDKTGKTTISRKGPN